MGVKRQIVVVSPVRSLSRCPAASLRVTVGQVSRVMGPGAHPKIGSITPQTTGKCGLSATVPVVNPSLFSAERFSNTHLGFSRLQVRSLGVVYETNAFRPGLGSSCPEKARNMQRLRGNRRLTVEECRTLGIAELVPAEILSLPVGTPWTISWPERVGCKHVGFEGVLSRWSADEWSLTLRHSMVHCLPPEPLALPFTLRITRTPCYYGGWRYWLRCPQVREGRLICRRRVTKLFLPPGEKSFGCRNCFDLTFRSVQEHDSRVDRLAKNPDLLRLALQSKDMKLMLRGMDA